jgi:hypothetical protein
MKGGFNKLLRNIVAGASDTEFEKVSLLFFNLLLFDDYLLAAID